MKYLVILLIALIAFSAIDGKVRRRHQSHHKNQSRGWKESGLYHFVKGFGITYLRNYAEQFLQCIGLNAAAVNFPAVDPDDNQVVPDAGDATTWQKIAGALGKVIDVICVFKDQVQGYLGLSRRLYMRRQRKLFAQGKRMMKRKWWDWLDSTWNKVKDTFNATANAMAAKVKQVGTQFAGALDWAKATAADVANWVKDRLKDTVAVIAKAFEAVKDRFKLYFSNNKFDALKGFSTCIMAVAVSDDGLGKTFNPLKVFKDAFETITGLTTIVGWAKLLVNLICNWANLKDAVDAIVKAYQATDKLMKWEYSGVAAAKFLISIAG